MIKNRILRLLLRLLILTVTIKAGYVLYNFYSADVNYESSQNFFSSGSYADGLEIAIENANSSIEKNPLEPNYYKSRAKLYLNEAASLTDTEKVYELKMYALQDMQRAYEINPKNIVTVRNLVPLYYFLTVKDFNLPSAKSNIDERFVPIVKDFYTKTKQIARNDVGVYVLLALYEEEMGMDEDLTLTLERIKELRPDLLEWYLKR